MNVHKIIAYLHDNPKRVLFTALPQVATLLFFYLALVGAQQAMKHNSSLTQALAAMPNPIQVQQLPLTLPDYQRVAQTMGTLYPALKFIPEPDGLRINAAETGDVTTWFSALDAITTIEVSTRWAMPEMCISAKVCNPAVSAKVTGRRDIIQAR